MPEPLDDCTVDGQVAGRDERELAGLTVQAFDRDLPSLERFRSNGRRPLATAVTDDRGRFHLGYTLGEIVDFEAAGRADRPLPDLSFRVLDPNGRELPLRSVRAPRGEIDGAAILFNAESPLELTLILGDAEQIDVAELDRVRTMIAPVIGDIPVYRLQDDDIDFLVGEAGEDDRWRDLVEWLRRAARLAVATGVPIEAFYGWGRMDLPMAFDDLARIPAEQLGDVAERLTGLSATDLEEGLRAAIHARIIAESFTADIAAAVRHLLGGNEIRHRVTGKLRDTGSGEALSGCTVTTMDADASSTVLGVDVTDVTGTFAFTFSAAKDAMTRRRFVFDVVTADGETIRPQPSWVADLAQGWSDPIAIAVGATSPVMPTLSDQLPRAGLAISEDVATWLDEQHIRSFADIRRRGGRLPDGDRPAVDAGLVERVEALADLDRISADAQANAALVGIGYHRVRDIASVPQSVFIARAITGGAAVDPQAAAELHAAATVQTVLLNNVLAARAADAANGFPQTPQ